MYIVENECLEEIRKIWIENNSGYIGNNCNLRSINDNNMLKVVCKTDTDVCGVVCFKRLIHHDMSKSLKTYKATKQKGDPHEQTENNRPV